MPVLGRDERQNFIRTDAGQAAVDSANEAFVDLDQPGEHLALWAEHGAAELMHPHSRRLIRAEAQDALQPEVGYAILLGGYGPDG